MHSKLKQQTVSSPFCRKHDLRKHDLLCVLESLIHSC